MTDIREFKKIKKVCIAKLLAHQICEFVQTHPGAESRTWPLSSSATPLVWMYVYYEDAN